MLGVRPTLLLALPGSALGQMGDLVESMIKRGYVCRSVRLDVAILAGRCRNLGMVGTRKRFRRLRAVRMTRRAIQSANLLFGPFPRRGTPLERMAIDIGAGGRLAIPLGLQIDGRLVGAARLAGRYIIENDLGWQIAVEMPCVQDFLRNLMTGRAGQSLGKTAIF